MTILAIDPGPTESAYLFLQDGAVVSFKKIENPNLPALLRGRFRDFSDHCVIEMIASYGMPVGAEIFETCVWIGRFMEAFGAERCSRLPRLAVKQHLCHDSRAKDGNVRAALIDRFGGKQAIRKGGPLYKVSGDVWAALGVAVTFWDQQQAKGAAA